VIFFVPTIPTEPPILWVLSVLQKTRDDFTKAQIQNFDLRRTIVLERYYKAP
jgi:hypothetical protein